LRSARVASARCSGPPCVVASRPHTLRLREVERRTSGRPPFAHPAGSVRPVAHLVRRCGAPLRSPSPAATEPKLGRSPSHASTRLAQQIAPAAEAIGAVTLRPAGRRHRVCPTGRLAVLGEIRDSLGVPLHIIETPPAPPDVYPHDAGTPCGPGSARGPRSPAAPLRGKPRSFALPSIVHRDLKEPLDVQV